MKKLIIVLPVLFAFALSGCSAIKPIPIASPSNSSASAEQPSSSSISSNPYPPSETEFVKIIEEASKELAANVTDIQRSQIIKMRDEKLCAAVPGNHADSWVGSVHNIGATGDGNAYIEVEIAPTVVVQTWNNALSDLSDHTLIQPGSSLFQTLAPMKVETKVSFSGDFLTSSGSCLERGNATEIFYGTDPNFVFRFSDITNQ